MRGVFITRIQEGHEDSRRKIQVIQNGLMDIKNLKILRVKEDSFLGGKTGHWHTHNEMMVILEGEVTDYVMENIFTKEKETFNFKAGDIVFRGPGIIHGGKFKAGTIVLDGGDFTYLSPEFNDIPREETK